jgi:hypothetical protein
MLAAFWKIRLSLSRGRCKRLCGVTGTGRGSGRARKAWLLTAFQYK